jgi:two-component system cell cycle response regulator
MAAKPLSVLLATHEAQLVRHISRFLKEFGYDVCQAADPAAAFAAWDARRPALVIVDDEFGRDGGTEFCRQLRATNGGDAPYMLLLGGASDAEAVTSALEAGVDDFVIKPVVYGEFLARLRAAARLAEVDRRVALQSRLDALTNLANREAFVEKLRHALAHQTQPRPAGLVLIDLDWFSRVAIVAGREAADAALVEVAAVLRKHTDPNDLVARFDADRFAVWLGDERDQDANAWAELARQEIAKLEIGSADNSLRLTACCGVVSEWQSTESADALLDRARQAVVTAKTSGRDTVVQAGQFAEEELLWNELAAPGKLFEDTTARDVMIPCATALHVDDTLMQAAAKFRRTGASSLPVTEKSGALVGLVTEDIVADLPTGRNSETRRVRDVMSKTVPRYQPETSFNDLMDFFVRGSGSVLVVVENSKPIGIVTRNSITSLIEPVKTDTFAPAEAFSASGEFLLVAGR